MLCANFHLIRCFGWCSFLFLSIFFSFWHWIVVFQMTQLSFFFLWYPSDFIRWTKSWKFLNQGWRKRRKNKWRDEKLFYSLFINCWKKGKWKERFLSIAGVKEPFYYVRRTRSCIYDSSPFCIYNSSPFFLIFGMAKGRMSMHSISASCVLEWQQHAYSYISYSLYSRITLRSLL